MPTAQGFAMTTIPTVLDPLDKTSSMGAWVTACDGIDVTNTIIGNATEQILIVPGRKHLSSAREHSRGVGLISNMIHSGEVPLEKFPNKLLEGPDS